MSKTVGLIPKIKKGGKPVAPKPERPEKPKE